MGYIVKLIPEEVYFVPNDHEIGMTESREKAIAEGCFLNMPMRGQKSGCLIKTWLKILITSLNRPAKTRYNLSKTGHNPRKIITEKGR